MSFLLVIARRACVALLCVAALLPLAIANEPVGSTAVAPSAPDTAKIDLLWGVKIPLRDGVRLTATLYRPRGQTSPSPCIFVLSPYVAQLRNHHDRGTYFAAHGYPFLIVEARGRGNSEGEFRPFIQEANDGYDVVEWLAQQPYCNGKVTMWGGSYSAYAQWATAKEFPQHLATIVPAGAAHANVDLPIWTGDMPWLALTSGRTSQDTIYFDRVFWSTRLRELLETGRPLKELDRAVGIPSEVFQEWLRHPQADAYWDRYNPTPEQYAKLSIPILTLTAAYDGAGNGTPAFTQLAALAYFREHMRSSAGSGGARHYLLIGPWDHAGIASPRRQIGGLNLGEASLVDMNRLHLQWYAWTMQDGPRPELLRKAVTYYEMGAERWCYADTLAEVTAESRKYFFNSAGSAADVFASGSLEPYESTSGADRYVYDPRDTRNARLESNLDPNAFITDQSLVYASSGRQLVYHTAPFDDGIEISGFFRLSAWISIDQPDTDFAVTVYEVLANGDSIQLTGDRLRARYRVNPREPQVVRTNAPLPYEFNQFSFISRRLSPGSRLRVVISPINSINSQKNYNSGGDVASESISDARPVTVKFYHDRAHPSVLYVPVGYCRP